MSSFNGGIFLHVSPPRAKRLLWAGDEGGANMNISTKLAAGIRPSTMSSSRRLRRLFYGINSTRASHSHMPRYCYFIGDTWVVGCRSKEGGLVTMCTLHCYVLRKMSSGIRAYWMAEIFSALFWEKCVRNAYFLVVITYFTEARLWMCVNGIEENLDELIPRES